MSTVTTADVPRPVRSAVSKVIRERFGEQLIGIRFVDCEMDDAQCSITIEIVLKEPSQHRAENRGVSLFGLTSQVRKALGMGEEVFPVLRPVSIHA